MSRSSHFLTLLSSFLGSRIPGHICQRVSKSHPWHWTHWLIRILRINRANYVIGECHDNRPQTFASNFKGIDGEFELVFGTSASSPVVGSIITLVNDARIAVGKRPVGFLNPVVILIYLRVYCSHWWNILNRSIPTFSNLRSMTLRPAAIKDVVSRWFSLKYAFCSPTYFTTGTPGFTALVTSITVFSEISFVFSLKDKGMGSRYRWAVFTNFGRWLQKVDLLLIRCRHTESD